MKETAILKKELSEKVLGIAFTVHNKLGAGLYEHLYEKAFCLELEKERIPYKRQAVYPVHYDDVLLGKYQADIVVSDSIILELKAAAKFNGSMEAQIINYMKISGIPVGYLINFHNASVEWKRFINTG